MSEIKAHCPQHESWNKDCFSCFMHRKIQKVEIERDQAREERDAAVAQQAADLRSYQGIAQALSDTMKEIGAQRDAAVEALADYAKHAADSGWRNLAKEIRSRLARLPHAAERARLIADVVAAARDVSNMESKDAGWVDWRAVYRMRDALKRLDALESGGGE